MVSCTGVNAIAAMLLADDLITCIVSATGSCREEIWTPSRGNFWSSAFYAGPLPSISCAIAPPLRVTTCSIPWRHRDDWNKPSNRDQPTFDGLYAEAMARTDFARERRIVLRGKTTEVIDKIPDASLDIVYIDGDHMLRGITIDLCQSPPRRHPGRRRLHADHLAARGQF